MPKTTGAIQILLYFLIIYYCHREGRCNINLHAFLMQQETREIITNYNYLYLNVTLK